MANPKVPPHSEEAEVSVLGAILIDKDAIIEIAGWLRPEHFYKPIHEMVYKAMLELYEQRKPIDLLTVSENLKAKKQLKIVGGAAYLASLANQVPTAANIAEYGKMVRNYAIKRSLIAISGKLAEMGFDESVDSRELLDKAESEVFTLSEQGTVKSFISVREALAGSFDRIDELHKNSDGIRGVPTGFPDLDDALAGMQNSNLIILAARPGMGKTTLGMNIAHYAAVQEGIPVGIFSLEMSSEELVDRLLVAQADIDAWKLKTGKLGNDDLDKLTMAMGELAEAPIYIDDTPGLTITEMRTRARRLKMEHGVRLIMVDYLQLASGGTKKYDSRVQEVQEISMGLKNIARELKIPVVALSQLSRLVEQRGTKKPQLSDLRESGSIEQDADVVMFIWREDDEHLERVMLSIEKHRNGPLRTIPLYFKGDRIRFYGVESKHATENYM